MAVTLRVDDLIQPEGELANSFFPDGDLDERIDGWLDRAATRVEGNANIVAADQDTATAHLVYHYAYSYIAGRIASMPNNTTIDGGGPTVAFGADRITYWQQKADSKLVLYDILAATPRTPTTRPVSVTVPVNAVW